MVGWIIGGLLAMVIAAAIAHLARRRHRWLRFKEAERLTAIKLGLGKGPTRIDATPDCPQPFGYKMAWIAVPATDPQEVARDLGIAQLEPANWRTGLWAAYKGRLFITPSIGRWMLVACYKLPGLGERNNEHALLAILQSLSQRYGEAQYFATHRVVDYHVWTKYAYGSETRAFAYLGERGETLVDRGEKTPGEVELGYDYYNEKSPLAETDEYWQREDLCYPRESHVMEVAGKWSINPTLLDESDADPATGFVGDYVKGSSASS